MSEFREFIARGNVVDLAVGVIIGSAFGAVVKSLVDQVIMPPIGWATGGIDFSALSYVIRPDDPATPASELVAIQYGAFLNTVISFLIVAWVVFLLVKGVNSLRRAQAEAPPEAPAPTPSEILLTEIRDLLKIRPATGAATAPPTVTIAKPAAVKARPTAKPLAKPRKS